MLKLFGLALTVAAAAILVVASAQALAGHVRCGDVIVRDTTLDSDLIDCRSGLAIGADRVTLDLNGHTIDGDGAFGAGVENRDHDGVVIENGTITEFDDGVRLGEFGTPAGNVLRRLTVRDVTETAIAVSGTRIRIEHNRIEAKTWQGISLDLDDSVISDNSVSGSVYGVFGEMAGSVFEDNLVSESMLGVSLGLTNSRMARNTAVGNQEGMYLAPGGSQIDRNVAFGNDGNGIRIGRSFNPFIELSSNRITRNVAQQNGHDGISIGDGHLGPAHSPQFYGNTVAANRVSKNGRHGLFLLDAGTNSLQRNRAFDNGATGMTLIYPRHNRIVENRVTGNAADGIAIYGRDATEDNLLSENRAVRNEGAGISVSGFQNRIEGNVTNENVGDGILIFNFLPNVVRGNFASRNRDDGIDLNDEAPSTVTRNTTNRNLDLGISAFEGVIDGGLNRARLNGNPLQCLVVSCRG